MKTFACCVWALLAFWHFACAQDTLRFDYDKDWEPTTNPAERAYHRVAFYNESHQAEVRDYYANNALQMSGTYANMKFKTKNGHFTYYSQKGNKTAEGDYLAGKEEGYWRFWDSLGGLQRTGYYSKGLENDMWTYYHDDQTEKSRIFFKNGEAQKSETYFSNHVVRMELLFGPGNALISGVMRNVENQIIFQGNYKRNLPEGQWTRTFTDGSTKVITFNKGINVETQLGGIVRKNNE